ncbi:hypothetical protein ANO11243_035210 [Dothideomycetidae sp. 11243]|nr:hypothetical protein ANO11243_035210 [fungal sp. No.11243]
MLQCGYDALGSSARNLQAWRIHLRRLATSSAQQSREPSDALVARDQHNKVQAVSEHRREQGKSRFGKSQSAKSDWDDRTLGYGREEAKASFKAATRRAGSIPFENFRHMVPQQRINPLESTVTRREGAAFRRLQDLKTRSTSPAESPRPIVKRMAAPEPARRSTALSGLDDLLDSIEGEAVGIPVTDNKPGKQAGKTNTAAQSQVTFPPEKKRAGNPQLKERRKWRLNQNSAYRITAQEIKTADSDVQIWEILQKEVFKAVAELHLESPTMKLGDYPSDKMEQFFDLGVVLVDPLETIGSNFAHILSLAAEVLRTRFPTSPLQLSLIPELRKLGPTYFALGVTTDLYNHALEHALKQEQDLPGGLDILDEMDREVIEPNRKTLDVLSAVVHQARLISRGEYGQAVRMLWQTERNRTALKEFKYRASKLHLAFKNAEAISKSGKKPEPKEAQGQDNELAKAPTVPTLSAA